MYLLTTMQGKKLCAGKYSKCYNFWAQQGSRRAKCSPAILWRLEEGDVERCFEMGVAKPN
jgi:hypothetical protein